MKKLLWKKENILYLFMFLLLIVVHLPLLTKTLLTADVLLNNSFYNGYSWELSLGRFGLYVVGLLKNYLSIPHVELFISFILINMITYLLIKLFEIDSKVHKIFIVLFMVLSPIISATLLFHYCSVPYFIAFLCGIGAVYTYYFSKNKYLKYLLPVVLMIISLSMYQAYLSLIVSVFMFYQMKLILNKKIQYKESGIYLLLILASMIIYYVGVKLSLLVFHVDMASYSNANSIGISTLLHIPSKLIDSYQLFFQMFFTNDIMKNTYLWNHVIHGIILLLFIIQFGITTYKSKTTTLNKVILCILLLLIPVFLNSVIFVISDAKLQLLMSASYLILPIFFLSILDHKKLSILTFICLGLLFRNYFIQNQATYLTLENTYKAYDTVIQSAIQNHINELDKSFIVIGNISNKNDNISNRNYGYISDEGLFWDEYNLRKLGFERFCRENYGLSIKFGDEDVYQESLDYPEEDIIYEYRDTIVINLFKVQGGNS